MIKFSFTLLVRNLVPGMPPLERKCPVTRLSQSIWRGLFTSMKPFSLRIGALRMWHVQSEGRECKGGRLPAATLSPFIFCTPQDAYPLQHKSRLAGYKLGCQFFVNRLACRASVPDVLSTGKLGENINWYWMGGERRSLHSFHPPPQLVKMSHNLLKL